MTDNFIDNQIKHYQIMILSYQNMIDMLRQLKKQISKTLHTSTDTNKTDFDKHHTEILNIEDIKISEIFYNLKI